MKKRLRQNIRHKRRLSTKLVFVMGALSITLTLTTSWLVFLNLNNLSKTRATGNGQDQGGTISEDVEVILEFRWENDSPIIATTGPDALRCNKDAHVMPGGKASTRGLAPGPGGKDVNLEFEQSDVFNLDGIDISIDYRRTETDGNFFTRGNIFNFGIEDGFLAIVYHTDDASGNAVTVKERTEFEIPMEPVFRNYRFIYSPASGKGEIFVNGVIVWSHQGPPNTPLIWNNAGNIIIGKNMNGGGIDRPVFDNLVVRTTGTVIPLSESLLSFVLEKKDGGVRIHWATTINDKVDYFSLEKSSDGLAFDHLTNIKAYAGMDENDEYTFTDKNTGTANILYYRVNQVFQNGKSVVHPAAAIRMKSVIELTIDNVTPLPFDKTFDISYIMPRSGRVWFQLTDKSGNILSTESFEAPQGKNIHVFRDQLNLKKGEYVINLIFENKKKSARVIKG